MAHALTGHSGKCRNIHGHRYKLTVTYIGTPNNISGHQCEGMVEDFGVINELLKKEVTDVFDHSLVLAETKGQSFKKSLDEIYDPQTPIKLIITPFQPTAENLLVNILSRLNGKLDDHVKLVSLKLYESENSCAEWHLEDQK